MNHLLLALAGNYYNPVSDRLYVPPSGDALTLSRIELLLRAVGNYLMIFGIIIAVIAIAVSGITWMTSPDEKAQTAKIRLKNSIYGTAIFLGVGLIIKTIYSIITGTFFCGKILWIFSFGC